MQNDSGHPPCEDDFSPPSNASQALVLCEFDQRGYVVRQNAACLKLCGNRAGLRCFDGCRKVFGPTSGVGLRAHKNVVVHGKAANIAELGLKEIVLVAIDLHDDHYRNEFALLSGHGLTPAEERVIKMRWAGFRARSIAEALFISLPTVKTHLLHAFQKLPTGLVNRIRAQSAKTND